MIKIDDKELRNPVEQIKKNMDDIADLKGNIKAQTVYSYKGLIGGTSVTQVNRSSTNVPDGINEGWLTDYTGKLFRITGGNTTTLLIDYYASIKGASGTNGTDGVSPVITIVPFEGGNQVQVTDVNGTQKFNVFNGTDGVDGQDGLTTAIYVNGQTYTQEDGTITLPDYTDTVIDEDIIPKAFNTYVLGDNTHSYKEVVANKFKGPNYYNISGAGINGHGQINIRTTDNQDNNESLLQMDNKAVKTNVTIAPISGNTVNLGQAANGFNNLYLDGKIITDDNLSKGLSLPDTTNWEDDKTIATTDQLFSGDYDDLSNKPDLSNFVTSTDLQTELQNYVESSDLATVATSGEYSDLIGTPTIPTVEANSASTPTDTLNNINIDGTVYSIPQGGGSGNSSSGIYLSSADLDTTVNYNKIILISTITLGNNTLAVDDIIIGANKYVGVVTTIGVNPNNQPIAAVKTLGNINDQDLSNYVTTTALTTTLADYELKSEAFSGDYDDLTDKPDLSIYAESANLATVATSGSYTDLINKPSIPNVYNSTITIQKNGTDVDSFKLNQSTAKAINITVPTVTSDLTNDSGYITNSALTPYINEVVVNGDTYTPVNNVVDLGYITPEGSTLTSGKIYRHRIMINTSNTMNTKYIIGEYLTGDSTAYFNGTTVTGSGLADYFSGVQAALDNGNTYYFGNKFYYNNKEYNDITNRLNTDSSLIYIVAWGNKGFMYFPKPPTLSTTTTTISSQTVVKSVSLSDINSLTFATNTKYYLFDNVEEYVEFGLVEPVNTVKSIEVNGSTYTPTSNVVTLPDYPTLPTLATVATTGDYDDLVNKPTIPIVNYPVTDVQVDGVSVLDGTVAKITTPSITQVQANWTESDNTKPDYIKNKPNLATVATSGSYNDLIDKPTIPEDITIITLSGTSGSLTAEQITLMNTNPEKVIFALGSGTTYYYTLYYKNLDELPFSFTYATASDSTVHYLEITLSGTWEKKDLQTAPVTSVNGQTGAVNLTIPDVSNYIQKSNTAGLVKNDGTIDTNVYALNSALSDYVTTNTAQTISGQKEFSGIIQISGQNDQIDFGGATVKGRIQCSTSSGNMILAANGDLSLRSGTASTGGANNYSLKVPDTTSYTADKTIATTDDIPDIIGEVIFNTTPTTGTSAIAEITTTKDMTQYDYIEIYFTNNDSLHNKFTTKFQNPALNDLLMLEGVNTTDVPRAYLKAAYYEITANNKLTFQYYVQTRWGNNEATSCFKNTTGTGIRPYKIIGYKTSASPQIVSQPMYENGDKFVNTNYFNAPGYITSGSKEATMQITVPKMLTNITSVTVNKFKCLIRGVDGYVNGTSYIDYASTTGYTVNAYISSENTVTLQVVATSAYSGATNNTPIQFAFSNTAGDLELTFNVA